MQRLYGQVGVWVFALLLVPAAARSHAGEKDDAARCAAVRGTLFARAAGAADWTPVTADTALRGTTTLVALFEAEGVSVSRWIRERRLERCRSALVDPRWRGETVTTIGMRWGLTDAAHFSRLFRETYGCTPTEYRRLDLPAAS